MKFAQRRNRLTTQFSERIPVVKRCISVFPISEFKWCRNIECCDWWFMVTCLRLSRQISV